MAFSCTDIGSLWNGCGLVVLCFFCGCHGMSVMQCKWQQISFSKRNIFLYTENKTRICRTKYNWSVLLELNRNIRRTKTATSICSTAVIRNSESQNHVTQEERLLWISTAQRLQTATNICSTQSQNNTKLLRRRRSTPANPVVPLRLTTGAPHRSR